MSGAVGIFLGVIGWWTDLSSQKRYFIIAAGICIIVSSFAVWYSERKERLRLESESGPNLLLRVIRQPLGPETFKLIGDGTETALNVEMQAAERDRIKVDIVPQSVPFVQMGNSVELKARFYEEISPNATNSMPLFEFLECGGDVLNLVVRFENAKGTRFRRGFILKRQLMHDEIQCFPQPREICKT